MTTYININGDVREASSLKIPADRAFRSAWSFNGDAVEVDMKLAKDIWRDKIRHARNPAFGALDAAFMKALETGADTSEIAAAKAVLRDAPSDKAIRKAETPEELMKVQPIPNVKVE